MRAKTAKAIKKGVYGDMSIRNTRYTRDPKTGQILCVGHKALYKAAKKVYKERKRDGMFTMQKH